ncbi:TlpA family protein disulfide reductase [Fodinibius halophilus]|uniref:TlpA family protein disulfide reductase n=1 Tax=Fodinibius halophilus TaxID=1736908 RepID=A0A6M1T7T6_9BACT|nr:TlpA disulfide reductase family protein [Fodinibius halophilus]NGP88041.1 TlpA family protein disulfide reductase [Fodinibius halophilus]
MRYLNIIFISLLSTFLLVSSTIGQNKKKDLQGVFVDLTKHEGWGPFSPREEFEPIYYTGTFSVGGTEYKVFQLKHKSDPYEERFIFRKVNSEVTFTEKEGGIIYYRNDEINLAGITFDIFGYSKRADQFVLIEKENVNYVQRGLKPGTTAPTFKAKDLFDQPISLNDYQDQYVLLDFWGTWCGPCLSETPYLKEAHKKFGDKVQFIGIAVDNKKRLIKYLKEQHIQWPQIYIPRDSKSQAPLIQKYNVYGYPAMFLIDPNGNIIIGPEQEHRLRGESLSETLRKVLSQKNTRK